MDILFAAIALAIAFFIGSGIEKRHFKSIEEREKNGSRIPFVSVGKKINYKGETERTELVMGSAVIGADYFKYVLTGLVSFFGGRISTLESVLDRARREAVLRLKEKANGADFITNVRYETCTLSESGPKSIPCVEIMVYGTAVYLKK